jgi:hypothetical protein
VDKTTLSATPPWTEEVGRRIPAVANPWVRPAFPRSRRQRDVQTLEADEVDRRSGSGDFYRVFTKAASTRTGVYAKLPELLQCSGFLQKGCCRLYMI